MPPEELLRLLLLLVREDDLAVEGLRHEEVLAERAGASPEHFVRDHRNYGTQREDEIVDVLLVEEVGRDSVRDGIFREDLRLASR